MYAPLTESLDERRCDARRGAGLRHELPQHRADADDDGDEA